MTDLPDAPPEAETRLCAIDTLRLSSLNPRKSHDPETIEALAASIRICGLIHNLSGLQTDAGVEIVAGGRRLAALQHLVETGWPVDPPPVRITTDIDQARRWAAAENTARIDLNPADEVAAYADMAAGGLRLPAIAAAFGVTERRVAQRLKLARLAPPALDALRDGRISLSQAGALTLTQGEDQAAEALALAERGTEATNLRAQILRDKIRAGRDRRVALIGLDTYEAAGGATSRDLFSNEVMIEDAALLDQLYRRAVEAQCELLLAKGWGWVLAIEETYIPYGLGDRHARSIVPEGNLKKAQRAACGGWICIRDDGSVATRLGFIRDGDQARARELGLLPAAPEIAPDADQAGDDTGTPGFSAALLADLRAVRHHTLIAALLESPAVAIPLLGWALSHRHPASILDIALRDGPLQPDRGDGFAAAMPGDDRSDAPPAPEFSDEVLGWRPDVLRFAAPLIRALRYGFSYNGTDQSAMQLYRAAEAACGCNLRDHWTPTRPGFFDRVPGAYLDQVFGSIFRLAPSHEDSRAFARLKKGEKANLLHLLFTDAPGARAYRLMTDEAAQRIAVWAPDFD